MNKLNKTVSAVFLYCKFTLFLKDQFFQIISSLAGLGAYRSQCGLYQSSLTVLRCCGMHQPSVAIVGSCIDFMTVLVDCGCTWKLLKLWAAPVE